MKICFLAHAGSIHTERWIRYFVDRGHSVALISFTPASLQYAGVDLHLLTGRWSISRERANLHYLLRLPRLRSLLSELKPDLINAHFLSSYGLMAALTRPAGCPLAVTLHGSDILLFPKRSRLHVKATRFALNRSDLICSVAQHITDTLPHYLTRSVPVLTMQYGLDLRHFAPQDGPEPRGPLCFSNRALVPLSKIETLVTAGQILHSLDSPLTIKVAGTGGEMMHLKKVVEAQGLGRRIEFIGQVDHREMPALLRSAAIYVTMARSDGTSLSLLEAMACGAFPVVSDIAANREWIEDGVNGYVVAPDSATDLAHKLEMAWADADLRRRAAEYNWALIQEKADYRRNMAAIESAFVDLAA